MIVFIPAAGLGTRLKPLTDHKPKALVEYQGKPLLVHLFEKLQAQGFRRFVLNLHHFAPMLRSFAESYAREHGLDIEFSNESALLLNTGGALTHALPLFQGEEAVLVHNVDIFSDLDLNRFAQNFVNSGADALLSVRQRATSRYLYAGADGRLQSWRNIKTGETKGEPVADNAVPYAFSGIHILKADLIEEWAVKYGTDTPFSVIDAYLGATSAGKPILLQEHKDGYWKDMGKIEDFRRG